MKNFRLIAVVSVIVCVLSLTVSSFAQSAKAPIAEQNVRAHMEFLASDAMQGRGSGTQFEWITAQYLASQLMQLGVEPAGNKNPDGTVSYLHHVKIMRNTFAEPPTLSFASGGKTATLTHGKEMVFLRVSDAKISGEMQKFVSAETVKAGKIVIISPTDKDDQNSLNAKVQATLLGGAVAVIIPVNEQIEGNWARFVSRRLGFDRSEGSGSSGTNIIALKKDAFENITSLAEGTKIEIAGKLAEPTNIRTWNTVGKITGSDPKLRDEVILLTAHMDHLGVKENAPGDDKIFNGADDDASGCVAVLELARSLSGEKPKRTVMFAFFGSEEAGGYGATYFVNNLPFPREKLVANLEFEMIGRPDSKVKPEELWLTGYERSNLGPELAKRGAKLVQDPHPDQNFFQRSDNYTLARQGIIAHTVSSYGLHTDYHHASDEIKTIDFKHMTYAINSMVAPINWLVNSDFIPTWNEGKKP